MSLGQRENRDPHIGAGGRVFITPLFLYIVICYVLLAGKPGPKALSAPGISYIQRGMHTGGKACILSILIQGLRFFAWL